jgi:hypothetical protein
MATSTLIQYLETEQKDGFGASVAVGPATLNRRQVETFLAAATIAAGDLVSLDASQTADGDKAIKIVKSDSAAAAASCPVGGLRSWCLRSKCWRRSRTGRCSYTFCYCWSVCYYCCRNRSTGCCCS